jgi:hypothetical protein
VIREAGRNRPLGRSKRRWNGNINVDLKRMESKDVNLIHLARDLDQ